MIKKFCAQLLKSLMALVLLYVCIAYVTDTANMLSWHWGVKLFFAVIVSMHLGVVKAVMDSKIND